MTCVCDNMPCAVAVLAVHLARCSAPAEHPHAARHGPSPLAPPGPDGEPLLDCKGCCGRGVLHPAPVKDKVAHGDVNLDINDFLAKIGV